jgi:tRNA1(Val) A37 N6-methylase TrmN6
MAVNASEEVYAADGGSGSGILPLYVKKRLEAVSTEQSENPEVRFHRDVYHELERPRR